MDMKSTQSRKSLIASVAVVFAISLHLGLFATASAHSGGYASDGNGNVLRDGNGNCVRADLGNPFPECEPSLVRAQPITKPKPPVKFAAVKPPPPVKVTKVTPKKVVKVKPQPKYITKTLSLNESSGANFGFDKDNLTSNAQQTLSSFAATVRNSNVNPSNISIVGHTDSTGPKRYNQTLSERRANSVASYLSNQGFDRRSMRISGMGESQPIASNKNRAGRAQNRRVDIRVTGQRRITVKQ